MKRLVLIEIRHERDVVNVRRRAYQLARELGFEQQDRTRIATAVSEIARNAFVYAGGGQAEIGIDLDPPELSISISDRGPGIGHLEEVLNGRYRSPTGMGLGLIGSRRLMERFDVQSSPRGTTVKLGKPIPSSVSVDASLFQRLADELTADPPTESVAIVAEENQQLLSLLSELQQRDQLIARLNAELAETNRGVVALYAELDEKAEALRRASDLKSRFLSNMSHEIRTPLNSILSLSRILLDRLDGSLTGEQERQVTFIRKSAETLLELINDLLDLAKIEAGKVEVKPHAFELGELFMSLRGMLKPLRLTDAVELIVEEPPPMPPLFTDEGKLSQVLRNLVANALKFTPKGEVRVRASRNDGSVTVAVIDTGIGIAPENHERIFEEFSQIDGPLQAKVKGTGLGLPLSRSLMTLIGGQLTLESAPGRGSTFTAVLPALYPNVPPPPELERAWYGEAGLPRVVWLSRTPPDPRWSHDAGLMPVMAAQPEKAWELLREGTPAALVLEIAPGDEPAWDLLSRVRADAKLHRLPIWVVSESSAENQAKALGADAFTSPPLDAAWLRARLRPPAAEQATAIALVIDDDEVARYLLKRMLGDARVRVIEAESGAEGLRRAREQHPSVVFLDLTMPGMDGFEVLERLRDENATRALPVIVQTSRTLTDADRERLRTADAVLSKASLSSATGPQQLRQALDAALSGSHRG